MSNSISLLGLQWGDEGKGKVVDLLSKDIDAAVRYQGGHNAGHTLIIDGKEVVFHLGDDIFFSQLSTDRESRYSPDSENDGNMF